MNNVVNYKNIIAALSLNLFYFIGSIIVFYLSFHGARKKGTLVNGLKFYFNDLSDINGPIRPGIVHRLDKDTSGVMLIAKLNSAHYSLATQFEKRTIKKEYFGILIFIVVIHLDFLLKKKLMIE